jgi:glycosyltransferase involved in cell wall biosynthesis
MSLYRNEIVFVPDLNPDVNSSGGLHKYASIIKPHLSKIANERRDLLTHGSEHSIKNTLPGYKKRFFLWDVYGISQLNEFKNYFSKSSGCILVPDVQDLECPENFSRSVLEIRQKSWALLRDLSNFKIIAMSNFTRNKLNEFLQIPKDRISVIGAGIDPIPTSLLELGTDLLNLTDSKNYILLLSKFWKHKNVQDLFNSISNIDDILEDANLYIFRVGGRNADEPCDISSRRVIDLGFRNNSEVTYLIKNAKSLIHPSEYEGFCMPVGESLYLDVPVSAFEIPAIRELVGKKYELIELRDYSSIIVHAIKLAKDDNFRQNNLLDMSPIIKNMTWESISRDIYFELVRD